MLTEMIMMGWLTVIMIVVFYLCKEVYIFIRYTKHPELNKHRLEHIKLMTVLAAFNITLIVTDIKAGVDFIHATSLSPVILQYLFMTIFIVWAGLHLKEEVDYLEEYYEKR